MPPWKLVQDAFCAHVQERDSVYGDSDENCDDDLRPGRDTLREDETDEDILKDDRKEEYG